MKRGRHMRASTDGKGGKNEIFQGLVQWKSTGSQNRRKCYISAECNAEHALKSRVALSHQQQQHVWFSAICISQTGSSSRQVPARSLPQQPCRSDLHNFPKASRPPMNVPLPLGSCCKSWPWGHVTPLMLLLCNPLPLLSECRSRKEDH